MSLNRNQVIVLQAGYSHIDATDASAMRANCSCTLIRCRDGTNIIVDTFTAWDGEHLTSLLAAQGLQVDDIHVVICTHGHSDHVGCNYLFRRARLHMIGSCASKHDLYLNHEGALDANGEVLVEKTPGHTLSCVSVLVHNTQLGGTVGVCGDLFERCEDVDDENIWLTAGSENEKSQAQERYRMAQLCSFIVPGHGPMFAVDELICAKLKQLAEKYA
ncbi:LOW QUALITY PROTEIN: metallo-beta-lactamase domain-containing protein 1 [Drosophila busckii]|uniref:LOW QUALITY PROTEIN: metallo-beta-lactamase domain-containing protein 1 n=1 Tax=Drosophila busckii TaxID=30019 RepID=UPI001433148D|nr:LOW QUALITY PROTEIN: metallo-beta-lactamase domain-containing protein 1 [Drosophila busckii]